MAHPADSWASSPAVRRSMQGNRRRDTSPELALRSALHRQGLRFRVDQPLDFDRRRRADITFPGRRVVVFVDGCFWHGCPEHYVAPRSNPGYWAAKVAGNRARDSQTTKRLEDEGWTVLRFWEHEDLLTMVAAVSAAVAGEAPAGQEAMADGPQATVGPLGRAMRIPSQIAQRVRRRLAR